MTQTRQDAVKKEQDPYQPYIPGVGRIEMTNWLLRNVEVINNRIWGSHYERSRYHFYDIAFQKSSKFHMPYLPQSTRNYALANRINYLPYYGSGHFLLHYPVTNEEIQQIIDKVQGVYNKQLESNGDFNSEFRNYVLRQVARTTPGRNAFDVARIYSEYQLRNLSSDNKVLVAQRCELPNVSVPEYSMTEYPIRIQNSSKSCFNNDHLFLANQNSFGIFNIETGENSVYEQPLIEHVAPITTGGFIFSNSNREIYYVKGVDEFTGPMKTNYYISSLKSSHGLQSTFVALNPTKTAMMYGSKYGIKELETTPVEIMDVYNKNVYLVSDSEDHNSSVIKFYDDGVLARNWTTIEKINKIKYIPEKKLLVMTSKSGFSFLDPRVKEPQIKYQFNGAKYFAYSDVNHYLCLASNNSIEFYEERSSKPFGKIDFPSSGPILPNFKIGWLRNKDLLAFASCKGVFAVLCPDTINPVLESYSIPVSEKIDLSCSFNTVLVRQENNCSIFTQLLDELHVPAQF
ncbi:hypothetical protein TVAG_212630 [Trichomonas vaginalis G3]|uniref:Uncharacterized protein n=1 Tax=Trichomonas vaginalis (strain ATCC PRA-98 / G3) TaxID=412133 RepID=A2E2Q3_TRIV3|nr:WD40 repeat-like family [Trichomonas vaginalis G3]EAY13081.1 hypothetical protein TVAG_212630 [Trichomonas vaginalis G3]KAI5548269.1 WD40 repeat-like family [Trichomonas vaginalis G3]|eukprot:XP_001325304.1 hypothetical protein [Trichomonas vaginalis G3]